MSSVTSAVVFVGLDYHAASVQVCGLSREGKVLLNRSCKNDWRAVVQAVREHCGPEVGVQAAIEACCGAASLADELIGRAQWSVDLAHAGYVARMKQSPDKTDFSDARMLADLERVGYLPRVWLAPEEVRERFASCGRSRQSMPIPGRKPGWPGWSRAPSSVPTPVTLPPAA